MWSHWPRSLTQLFARGRARVQRHWPQALRVRERLPFSEQAIHLMLAVAVGLIGGVVNLGFHLGYDTLQQVLLPVGGATGLSAASMSWWRWLITPALGGLAAGWLLCWGLRWVGRQGTSNLLEVVVAGDGRLPLRTNLLKALSSLVSISTGASIGREGLITQLAATLASKWGQLRRWQPYRLRLLVACGAASGLAAAYNAPLAGAVFAAQIVLGNFSMNLFAPLALSALVASMVSRSFFGFEPWYQVPTFDFTRLTELPWFFLLGVASGIIGAAFLRALRWSEMLFDHLPDRLCARLALAGLMVGAISVGYPEVWGNGYEATNRILHTEIPLDFLMGLFLAKVIATLVTVGAGTVGGVFTPTLFVGAALGCVCGTVLHEFGLALLLPTGAFALVGMGSVLAATVHSPLLAMIIVFELSLNYSIMPPLMLACVVSSLVARWLHRDSIYSEPLRRKGLPWERESGQPGAATQQTVGDLMREPVPPLRLTATLRETADRFLASSYNFLPVVDGEQRLVGAVALQDLKEHLNSGQELQGVIAYDVMQPPPPCLTPNQTLLAALPLLLSSELRHIPVVNNLQQKRLVGSVVRVEALGLLSEAIARRTLPQA